VATWDSYLHGESFLPLASALAELVDSAEYEDPT
jgi:hypothetical protein